MTDHADVRVSHNPERHRFEAYVDDELAGVAEYVAASGQMVLHHTEVAPRFEGRGIGGQLAATALDTARAEGLAVQPRCSFIAAYIRDHAEYADLVDPDAAPPPTGA